MRAAPGYARRFWRTMKALTLAVGAKQAVALVAAVAIAAIQVKMLRDGMERSGEFGFVLDGEFQQRVAAMDLQLSGDIGAVSQSCAR